MEFPRLFLGLIGFDSATAERLSAACLRLPAGGPIWQVAPVDQADAWLIAGESAGVAGNGAIEVKDAHLPGGIWSITREKIDRPLAFAQPVSDRFASAECYDVGSDRGLRNCLQMFEAWLRPLRAEFELAAQLTGRVAEFKGAIVHLVHESKLIAVVDLDKWVVGMHPQTRPIDVASAEWMKRPPRAADIPGAFNRQPFHRLMWSYAMRSGRDVLPSRYRQRPIHFRKAPGVPDHWLYEVHRRVIAHLQQEACTFEALQEAMQVPRQVLIQCLEALYFGGAITTNPAHARRTKGGMPKMQRPGNQSGERSGGPGQSRPLIRHSAQTGRRSDTSGPMAWIGRALWMGRFGPTTDGMSTQSPRV